MLTLLLGVLVTLGHGAPSSGACDKDRVVLTEYQGWVNSTTKIPGPGGNSSSGKYTENTHCQWLIRPEPLPKSSLPGIIHLELTSFQTECSYDYVFVYDGSLPDATKLIASLSGDKVLLGRDHRLLAHSGSMLIIFFSDLNYVLAGFTAKYVVLDCPHDCSGHGKCLKQSHSCQCDLGWQGASCGIPTCPGDCRGLGTCHPRNGCICQDGYGGDDCSLELPKTRVHYNSSTYYYPSKTFRSRWHRLPGSRINFTARTGHSSIYLPSTDSLYVFGGKTLGRVLKDLTSFRFTKDQRWLNLSYPDSSVTGSTPGGKIGLKMTFAYILNVALSSVRFNHIFE